MRSRHDALLAAVLALAACGDDRDPSCRTSSLSYDTVGKPYLENWCRGCHGEDVPPPARHGAPVDVDFDTLGEVQVKIVPVMTVIGAHTMPPSGGPSDDEDALMLAWLRCGAP
jgi:hypothetical protein